MDSGCVSKKYETGFQKFLERNINRTKMASMIYGVSRNGKRGIGYVPPKDSLCLNLNPKKFVIKPKALYSHFTYGHIHDI